MELLEKINKQIDEFKAKRTDLVKELQKDFPSLVLPILSQSKKIDSIGWTQYTPYFNDGDECIFGVNNSELYVNGDPEGDSQFLVAHNYIKITSESDRVENTQVASFLNYKWYMNKGIGEDGLAWNKDFDKYEFDLLAQIKKVLSDIPEDFYKELFGDHVRVTVFKCGAIETDEYDHE